MKLIGAIVCGAILVGSSIAMVVESDADLRRCQAMLGGWKPTREFATANYCRWTIAKEKDGTESCYCIPRERKNPVVGGYWTKEK